MNITKQQINQVREELPKVMIRINGIDVLGQLSGRQLDYPIVFVGKRESTDWQSFEFSWSTVTRAYLENRVLKI